MDLDVTSIDKNNKNRWRNIYKSIYSPYFIEVKIFHPNNIYHYNKNLNEPQKIPIDIKKNKKIILL